MSGARSVVGGGGSRSQEPCSGVCRMQAIMDVSHACMLSCKILMAATHTLMHCPCMHHA